MLRAIILLPCIAFTSSCTESQFADNVAIVEIEGHQIRVQKNKGDNDIWGALHLRAPFFPVPDPEINRRNVVAIEAVSGCKVDPTSLVHLGKSVASTAVVEC